MLDRVKVNEQLFCEGVGMCEAPKGARERTHCIYCGQELREKNGIWWTADHDGLTNPEPQDLVA